MSKNMFMFSSGAIDAYTKCEIESIYHKNLQDIYHDNSSILCDISDHPTNIDLDCLEMEINQKINSYASHSTNYIKARLFIEKYR